MLPKSCPYHVSLAYIGSRYVLRDVDVNVFDGIFFRTELRRIYVGVAGSEFWHYLPESVKSSVSLSIFKKRLIDFFVEGYKKL